MNRSLCRTFSRLDLAVHLHLNCTAIADLCEGCSERGLRWAGQRRCLGFELLNCNSVPYAHLLVLVEEHVVAVAGATALSQVGRES